MQNVNFAISKRGLLEKIARLAKTGIKGHVDVREANLSALVENQELAEG